MSTKKDKQHRHLIPEYFREAWKSHSSGGKLQLIASLVLFVVGLLVYNIEKLFRGKGRKRHATGIVEVEPGRIWQFAYAMRGHDTNCIIIKGRNGKLLLRSPPPIHVPEAVDIINKLGDPGVILASLAHDTYIDQWKEKFPDIKILAGKADVEVISDRVKVDGSIEDSLKHLENYYVVKVIPTTFTRYEDQYIIVQNPGTQNICLMPCGYANNTDFGIGEILQGCHGLTFMRAFAHLFAHKPVNADRQTSEVMSQFPDMKTFVFLHGMPVGGPDASKRMLSIHASKARSITPFGF